MFVMVVGMLLMVIGFFDLLSGVILGVLLLFLVMFGMMGVCGMLFVFVCCYWVFGLFVMVVCMFEFVLILGLVVGVEVVIGYGGYGFGGVFLVFVLVGMLVVVGWVVVVLWCCFELYCGGVVWLLMVEFWVMVGGVVVMCVGM